MNSQAPSRNTPNSHQRGKEKLSRIPVVVVQKSEALRKPEWIRIKLPFSDTVERVKSILRKHNLHSVCEEAACPNLTECFSKQTATFMILGDLCTRRCPFCDVAHGRPQPPDAEEPLALALAIADLKLSYVVITSVNRDDLKDGGATHFTQCIEAIKTNSPNCSVEVLVPDFRGRQDIALEILKQCPPQVFNHNLETVPTLYKACRPGASYQESLSLLLKFKNTFPNIPTKSGIMLGLGEERDELVQTFRDLRAHGCSMLTLGQYLQPSKHHYPVQRYVPPKEFDELKEIALSIGFSAVASGPLVRSSYFAEEQLAATRLAK
ncbi:MAG: lipoyl synthase [Methylacidiphilales bacterium]|nr:lipoyl synthase [Candidatus Methylacidiphilales bacterium]